SDEISRCVGNRSVALLPVNRIETGINLLGVPKYMAGRTTPTVTRRGLLKTGGVMAGGLLAGCSGTTGGNESEAGGNGTDSERGTSKTNRSTGEPSATTNGANSKRSYTVRAA